ncbi:MAG: hypothetical protein LUC98_04645 [Lachnospiraceae bacterium]|nr:hypothetical protein [Lachnospiraceae bacterium]
MNGNENKMQPQVPDAEMELADEKPEGASGGKEGIVVGNDGLCPNCQVTVKWNGSGYYCPSCYKPVISPYHGLI